MKWIKVVKKGLGGAAKGACGGVLATYGFGEGFSPEITAIISAFVGFAEAFNNWRKNRKK